MPKIVDHNAYRAELLNGCFELFARRGYAALTMRQIAKELDVSTGTLYHYFESKEDLFRKMLESLSQRDVSEAVVQLSEADSMTARIDHLFTFVQQREPYFRNLLFLVMDYYRHEEIQSSDLAVKHILANYKQVIIQETGLRTDEALSTLLFSLLTGLVVNRLLDPDSVDFSDQAALVKLMTATSFSKPTEQTG